MLMPETAEAGVQVAAPGDRLTRIAAALRGQRRRDERIVRAAAARDNVRRHALAGVVHVPPAPRCLHPRTLPAEFDRLRIILQQKDDVATEDVAEGEKRAVLVPGDAAIGAGD